MRDGLVDILRPEQIAGRPGDAVLHDGAHIEDVLIPGKELREHRIGRDGVRLIGDFPSYEALFNSRTFSLCTLPTGHGKCQPTPGVTWSFASAPNVVRTACSSVGTT